MQQVSELGEQGLGHLEAPKSPGRLYHRTRSFTTTLLKSHLPWLPLTFLRSSGCSAGSEVREKAQAH